MLGLGVYKVPDAEAARGVGLAQMVPLGMEEGLRRAMGQIDDLLAA